MSPAGHTTAPDSDLSGDVELWRKISLPEDITYQRNINRNMIEQKSAKNSTEQIVKHDIIDQTEPSSRELSSRSQSPARSQDEVVLSSKVIEKIRKQEEELQDLREDLIVSRLHLKEKRDVLGKCRDHASNVEAELMGIIRRKILNVGTDTPEQLWTQSDLVEAARDNLGAIQDDYTRAEQLYTDLESNFMRRQKKFVEFLIKHIHLSDSASTNHSWSVSSYGSSMNTARAPAPTNPLREIIKQYLYAVGTVNMIKEELQDMRSGEAEILDQPDDWGSHEIDPDPTGVDSLLSEDFRKIYLEKLDELQEAELEVHCLRQQVLQGGRLILDRRGSDPWLSRTMGRTWFETSDLKGAQSDTAVADLAHEFSNTRLRINAWILEGLGGSSLERVRHKAALGEAGLDNNTWWKLVKRFWNDEAPIEPSLERSSASAKSMGKGFFHAEGIRPQAIPQSVDDIWRDRDKNISAEVVLANSI